jgi:hypothetical protein
MLKINDIHKYSQKVVNGALVLTTTISNIENYTMEIDNSTLTLVPKKTNISDDQINKTHFTKSKILYSYIATKDDVLVSNKNTYFEILEDIWKTMPIQQVLQNTSFDFKMTQEKGHAGYWWNENLSMSLRLQNANITIKEIVKMVKLNGYQMIMTIQLKNNSIIEFKF